MNSGLQSTTRKDYMTNKELETRKVWEDDLMRGAEYTRKFIDLLMNERSQLYGVIIHLMLTNNIGALILPPIEEFKEYGKKYYVLFAQDPETKEYLAKLLEQENND